MKKLKKILNKISEEYKEYFKKYLFTNIGLILFTLYLMIASDQFFEDSAIIRIAITFICSNFLIESAFKEGDKKRIYLYLLSVGLAIIIGLVIGVEDPIAVSMYTGFNLICITTGLFFITKKEKKVSEYVCKVFYNLFKVELFTTVLLIGFGIIYLIVEELIIEGYNVYFYEKIFYFIIGIYNIPFSIMALLYTKDDIPEIVNSLIKRVLLVLLDISYVVIILYIIKMLVTRVMPENEVFAVVTMLYMFSLPMFIMLSYYKGKVVEYNCKILPFVLMAPILLQIYSLAVRIYYYGVTASRYIGIYIIIFEIAGLFLLLFKDKKYIKYGFLVISFLALLLFILPITNYYEAPIRLQVARLQSIWTDTTNEVKLTASDRQKIKDIYDYLNEYDNPDKYMPNYLSMERVNKYLMNTRKEFEGIRTRYFSFNVKDKKIDISRFNTLEFVNYNGSSISLDDLNVNIGETSFNLADDIKAFMKNEGEAEVLSFENGSGSILYVTNMSFYYNDAENRLESFHIKGYILQG